MNVLVRVAAVSFLLSLPVPFCAGAEMVIQGSHTVEHVAWGPGGELLVTAGDQVLKIWRAADGRLLRTLTGHEKKIEAIAFSPDGTLVASASQDSTVRLWNVDGTGVRILRPGDGGRDTPLSLAFSPDGSRIAAGWGASGITEWRLDGSLVFAVAGVDASHSVHALAFHPDGSRLYSAGGDHKLRAWDQSGRLLKAAEGHEEVVQAIAVSPDGSRVITGDWSGTVRIWTGFCDPVASFPAHAESVDGLSPGPDGASFASCSIAGAEVRLWRMSGDIVWSAPAFAVQCIAFAPDGASIVSGRLAALQFMAAGDGSVERSITASALMQRGAALFPDGRSFAVATGAAVRIWGTDIIPRGGSTVRSVNFARIAVSQDGAAIAGAGASFVELLSASGARLREWRPCDALVQDIAFLPPGNRLVSCHWDGTVVVSNADGSRAARWKAHDPNVLKAVAASPDAKRIATGGMDKIARVWSIEGTLERAFTDSKGWINDLAFSPDSDLVAAATTSDGVRVWRVDGRPAPPGSVVAAKLPAQGSVNRVAFSPEGTTIACGDLDSRITLWALDGSKRAEWLNALGPVDSIAFTPDGRFILVGFRWATQLRRVSDGAAWSLVLSDTDWVVYTEDGLFDASRGGGTLLAMTLGMDSIGIEQLAVTNNRPDLILDRLGTGDPDQVAWYARQHEKRLQRLGVRPGGLPGDVHVPQARILGVRQEERFATLEVSLADTEVDLASWTVFANDVPVPGLSNRPVAGRAAAFYATVELTAGANKLEVSCRNVKGAESYRQQVNLACDKRVARDLWFIGFGVSRYRDARLDLSWAHRDALDLAAAFARFGSASPSAPGTSSQGMPFDKVHTFTFTDAEVTPEAIGEAKGLLAGARPDDVLVVFIAGHGMHDRDPAATYYYLTWGADPGNLAATAADFDLVEDLFDGVGPRAKLFLMDTCESGEVDDTEQSRSEAIAGGRGIAPRAVRGLSVTAAPAPSPASPRAPVRSWLLDRERYILNDLRRRSGAIVFSSCRGGEYSYERDDLENGVFTEEILKALAGSGADSDGNGTVTVDELRAFVARAVAAETGDLQHPTVDRDNLSQKFGFPLARRTSR